MPSKKTTETSKTRSTRSTRSTSKTRTTKKASTLPKKKRTSAAKSKKSVSQKKEKEIKYIEAIGRRKTSTARVRFYESKEEKGKIIVNKEEFLKYFPVLDLQKTILAPIEKTENFILEKGKIEILVKGGGKRGQADAIQLGIARLILKIEPKYKTILKANGFLRRDPRMVERKKFGLKKARRAPQWQKR